MIGHSKGLSSLLVPGSGEPNFDSSEADPFENKRMRREREVKGLLDKVFTMGSIHSASRTHSWNLDTTGHDHSESGICRIDGASNKLDHRCRWKTGHSICPTSKATSTQASGSG